MVKLGEKILKTPQEMGLAKSLESMEVPGKKGVKAFIYLDSKDTQYIFMDGGCFPVITEKEEKTEVKMPEIVDEEIKKFEKPSATTTLARITTPPKTEIMEMSANPEEFITNVTKISTILRNVIISQKMSVNIGGKHYVTVDGWECLGALTNHTAIIRKVVEGGEGDDKYFEATAELLDGCDRVVSIGIARAYLNETVAGRRRDKFQVLSMAQTRAIGKAYRLKQAWIMRMVGYEGCPAEEMED